MIRYLLYFVFVFCSVASFAQTKTPFATTGTPIPNRFAYTNNGLWIDSTLRLLKYSQASDTVLIGIDSDGYAYGLTKATISSWSGGGGADADSSVYATLFRIDTAKLNLRTYIETKENSFSKGDIIQGAGVSITGTLTGRLVGSGNITIAATGSEGYVQWGDTVAGQLIPKFRLDTAKLNIRTSIAGKQDVLGFTPENVSNKSTDASFSSVNNDEYASTQAIRDYVQSGLATKPPLGDSNIYASNYRVDTAKIAIRSSIFGKQNFSDTSTWDATKSWVNTSLAGKMNYSDTAGLSARIDEVNASKEDAFSKGSLIQGSGVTITGDLENRLVGSGDITIAATGSAGFVQWSDTSGQLPTTFRVDTAKTAIRAQIAGKQDAGNYITALTGDIAASGPGSASATIANDAVTTTKINNSAVTYAKMQNMSGNRLLGKATDGSGTIGEIALGAGLSFSAGTLVPNLSASHIPNLDASKITSGTFTSGRIAAGTATEGFVVKMVSGSPEWAADATGTVDSSVFAPNFRVDTAKLNLRTDIAGKVSGPGSATDNGAVVFDGTSGKLVKSSTVLIGTNSVTASGNIVGGSLNSTSGILSLNDKVVMSGTGTPEGSQAANPGSLYLSNGSVYKKSTGTGNTGWDEITSGSGSTDSTLFLTTYREDTAKLNLRSEISACCSGGGSYTAGSVLVGSGSGITQDNSNFFWDNTTKMLGIGTSSPTSPLTVISGSGAISNVSTGTQGLLSFGASGQQVVVDAVAASSTSTHRPVFRGVRSRGTLSSPSAVQNADELMAISAGGYDGTNANYPSLILFQVDASVSTGAVPTAVHILTGTNSSDRQIGLTVNSSQHVHPGSNGSKDLGISTHRWGRTYTNKLIVNSSTDAGQALQVTGTANISSDLSSGGSITATSNITASGIVSGNTLTTVTGKIVLGAVWILSGDGSPEDVVEAPVGSTYQNTAGGEGTTFFVKEGGGTGSSGWAGK